MWEQRFPPRLCLNGVQLLSLRGPAGVLYGLSLVPDGYPLVGLRDIFPFFLVCPAAFTTCPLELFSEYRATLGRLVGTRHSL